MASAGARALTTGPGAITGFWGLALNIGAGLIDAGIANHLSRGRDVARQPRLLGVPVGSNEPGAPRIWACGQRVRVPCHVLWQSEKVREESPGGPKGSSGITQRRVFIDCLLSLNDRETKGGLKQLIGNGKLLLWTSRNLVQVTTSAMSAAETGGQLVVTMADQADPDLSEYFKVGDGIRLTGFVPASGTPNVNGVYWVVAAVTAHTSTATSTLTLDPAEGQTFAGASSTAGEAFDPGTVERIDDAEVGITSATWGSNFNSPGGSIFSGSTNWNQILVEGRDTLFSPTEIVRLSGMAYAGVPLFAAQTWEVTGLSPAASPGRVTYWLKRHSGPVLGGPSGASAPVAIANESATVLGRLALETPNALVRSLFPATFDPAAHFHSGDETQTPDSLLVDAVGAAAAPAYRGTAYQGLEQFEATQFGNALPASLEAIIDVDSGMTWADALRAVLEWHGIPPDAIDTGGMSVQPFHGYYLRGSAPASTQLQPLLVAGEIVAQERDGVLCFFDIGNADVVAIENGPSKTALGARMEGEAAEDTKLSRDQVALEDLPASVAIRHQDPDNVYAPGYQHFGLRNPSGTAAQNHREIDLSNLVLSRKAAANLAKSTLRRAHINSEVFEFQLDARYLDLLENDLVTVTGDDGVPLVLRTIQVDVGSNYLVKVQAVREDVNLEIVGSPVQTSLDTYQRPPVAPALLDVVVLDLPALTPQQAAVPTLLVAATPIPGSVWQAATVFESADGGNSWANLGQLPGPNAIGRLLDALPPHAAAETLGSSTLTYDTTTTFEVELSDLGWQGGLASCLPIEAELAGRNWCAVHDPVSGAWEILAFTTVVPTSATTFQLSGLLRGLRGTWHECLDGRPAGATFVMLTDHERGFLERQVAAAPAGATRLYRVVPVGATLDDVDSVGIVPLWRSATPPPPRRLDRTIGASPYDARFETEPESRGPLPLGTLGPYSMVEPFEEYVFTILDPTGTAVRRVKRISTRSVNGVAGTPNLRDRFVDYPAAEQTADGYTPGPSTTFVVGVQQVGQYGASALRTS